MKLDFIKIHGAGNDFIVVDDLSREIELTPEQVQALCDRNFGIGADGVILVRPSEHADCTAFMHYYNSDGTLAEMCGNGVRCFAKFLVDHGFVPVAEGATEGSFIADTRAGKRPVSFCVDEEGKLIAATVDMGEPRFAPEQIPTILPANTVVDIITNDIATREEKIVCLDQSNSSFLDSIRALTGSIRMICVNMGNPHLVVFLEDSVDLYSYDVDSKGSLFGENRQLFPEGTNVEFAIIESLGSRTDMSKEGVIEPTHIKMRVWERGCGETLACGTGACATAVAAVLFMGAQQACVLQVLGGILYIEWRTDNHVYLTGPAETVYHGSIEI